ncbi:hypothetical protein [Flavobacterium psychrotrophum]|uniref:hypothetical protein n=1 Tax=Flavobacterium psychrotrophum TaxID=2294119 RepID=UPI000E30D268|nr:hypothetical protein [Flavobacterium psychrotrophum]
MALPLLSTVQLKEITKAKMMMKRKYMMILGAGLLLMASCSSTPRYGCSGRRCIVETQKAPVKTITKETKQNA